MLLAETAVESVNKIVLRLRKISSIFLPMLKNFEGDFSIIPQKDDHGNCRYALIIPIISDP